MKCKKCFFFQKKTCILKRIPHPLCYYRIKGIEGIDDKEFYVNHIMHKRIATHTLLIAAFAMLISLLALIFKNLY